MHQTYLRPPHNIDSGSIYGVGGRFQSFGINGLEMVAQIFPRWNRMAQLAEGSGALLGGGLRPAPRP